MASINLLPGEEKRKTGPQEKPLIRHIELTSPAKGEREPKVRRGGVFAFLGNLFRKRIPDIRLEEGETVKPLPAVIGRVPGKTVVFGAPPAPKGQFLPEKAEREVKVIVEKAKPKHRPKPPREEKSGFFSRLFAGRGEMVLKPVPPPGTTPKPAESKPVAPYDLERSRVSILPPPPKKEIVFVQERPPKPEPKPAQPMSKKPSRFGSWLRRLFRKREKVQPLVVTPLPQAVVRPPSSPPPSPPPKPEPKEKPSVDRLVEALFERPAPPPPPVAAAPPEVSAEAPKAPAAPKVVEPLPARGVSFDVNLMPAELKATVAPRKKLLLLGVIAGAALLLVAAAGVGLSIYNRTITNRVAKLNDEIANLERNIASFASFQDEVVALKGKIAVIEQLLGQHIHWTTLLGYLESSTLPEVYYSSLVGDVGGKVTLAASTKDLTSVGRQLLLFRQRSDFVKDVSITGAKLVTGAASTTPTTPGAPPAAPVEQVLFSVFLTVQPQIFTTAQAPSP